jgi:hypothetical protein
MPSQTAGLFHPRTLAVAAAKHPQRFFWIFATAHLLLWTIIPSLTSPNAPLDVIEGYAWGREWLLGTYKHPPMQSWWLQILAVLTDRAPWAHFLASQIAVLVTFWAVWQTGRRMMSETAALVGVIILESVVYYNFTSTEFNPNVLQLPFWALICLSFHRAVKDNRLKDWLLLGIWSAGALYSKYSSGLLLIALSIFTVAQPFARQRLKGIGPYLTFLIAILLFAPHMVWLKNHDFLPFTYALDRMQESKPHHLPQFILSPLVLITGQFVVLALFLLLFLVFYGRNGTSRDVQTDAFDRAYLNAVTFGPVVLMILLTSVFGFAFHDMWGTPFWSFIGLWAIDRFHPSFSAESLTRFIYASAVMAVGILFFYIGSNILSPYLDTRTKRIHFPGKALATYITDVWHDRYHAPLRFAIGDTWPAGNIGYYAAERPHVFIFGDKTISPWIKTGDLDKYGGVIVWCVRHCIGQQEPAEDVPAFVHERFPLAEIQPPFSLARQTDADIEPVKMGWAIVAPIAPVGGQKP